MPVIASVTSVVCRVNNFVGAGCSPVREIEPKPPSTVIPPEFRLYSTDPEVSRILRNLDIIGVEIVFPTDQNRIADVLECQGETHYEIGKYAILRPKEHVERQVLRVMITFVQDFTEGPPHSSKAWRKI